MFVALRLDGGRPSCRRRLRSVTQVESLTADVVRARLLTGERHVFRSTRIVGRLDLSFLTIPVPIEFVGCEFEGRIDLTGAECSKLDLAESNLRQGLTAEFAHIRGPVFLNRGLTSNGQIRFTQATIDGDVDLSRATVTDVGSKPAISLRGAHVLGSVLMHRLRTSGEVRLQHAHIGGLLGLAGAQITVENAVALNLSGAEVTGRSLSGIVPG